MPIADPAAYDAPISRKARCKAALQGSSGSTSPSAPLRGHLAPRRAKGIDLVADVTDSSSRRRRAARRPRQRRPAPRDALAASPSAARVGCGSGSATLAHRIEAAPTFPHAVTLRALRPRALQPPVQHRAVVHATGGPSTPSRTTTSTRPRHGFVFRAFGRTPFLDAIRRARGGRTRPLAGANAGDGMRPRGTSRPHCHALYDAVLARPVRLL